ncbi:MAG: ATP-binding protein [Bacteroidia bacterium]
MRKLFHNRLFLCSLSILFLVSGQLLHTMHRENPQTDARKLESVLHSKEKRINEELDLLRSKAGKLNYNQLFTQRPDYYNSFFKKDGLVLLIYENDTLKFWSDNSVAVENYMKEVCLDDHMAKLKNGWFEVVKKPLSSSRTAVGLIHIKNEYPYQNHYLNNDFQHDFKVSSHVKLQINENAALPSVRNTKGEYLFSMHPLTSPLQDDFPIPWFQVVLNGLGIVLLILFIRELMRGFRDKIGEGGGAVLFVTVLILLRLLSIVLHLPDAFYQSTLFGPKYYGDAGSFWLSSLGDLLLNTLLLFYITFYISRHWKVTLNKLSGKKAVLIVCSFLLFFSVFWLSWFTDNLFKGLIHNSEINFSVNELFSLNFYSLLGVLIVGLLLFSFFLLTDLVLSFVNSAGLPVPARLILFIGSALFFALLCHLTGVLDPVAFCWSFAVIVIVAAVKRQSAGSYSFSGSILLVMILSMYSVHTFLKYTGIKEKDNRKVYAEKLSAEQDPIAEHLYPEVEPQLLTDSVLLHDLLSPRTYEAFQKRLTQRYFGGYWEKYDIRITYFDSACNALIKPNRQSPDNITYFDELITKSGQETYTPNLYYLQNLSGKISYLARIPIYLNSRDAIPSHLILVFESKFISEEVGFPELLLDRDLGITQQIANYSYAKYRNGKLVNQYGKYHYPIISAAYDGYREPFSFLVADGYNHLIHRPDASTLILISKPDSGLVGDVTTFSYLFAFYSLQLLLLLFLKQLVFSGLSISALTFKARIQAILVFIVLISLALFGFGTVFYIRAQYEAKNTENITEKLQSVLAEVDTRFEVEELDRNYREYSSFILKKLSNIFFTDINLYDANGNLYVSSRPEVFDEGLVSKKMNPEAYYQMGLRKKSEFVHDENIGNLNYLSAYVPFKNRNGKEIAFLNLPYFAKQSELEKEISTFLVALINIYVLLFAMSIIVAVIISNYLTRPLKLIQDKMSKVKLGEANELIEWNQLDEIGSLIREYNRMIEELARSADLLARSERESAWREMAKQVAHEIKNPLTPMKLSIQHMQRLIDDKSPDLEKKVGRLAQTLIEQIDTLSSIASEFSSFAKMPKAVSEAIDLKQLIPSSLDLFKETPGVDIHFVCEDTRPDFRVYADKEQLLRMLNNLLKNAVQAIPEDRHGVISVELSYAEEMQVIAIKDNGTGIQEDLMDKIFVPNFTTKSTGMGLGLAMVKSIVETFGGQIRFETKKDKGSIFYIYLPELKTKA